MEPNFDKEMDALLRQPHLRRGVLVGDTEPEHLDADQIAAFAENALPERTRAAFITHLADCGECRTVLAGVIPFNADPAAENAAVAAPAVQAAVEPWYRALFRAPNLAFAMGALVVVFAGFIGYLMLQNAGMDSSYISQSSNATTDARGPMADDLDIYSANSAANMANIAAAPESNASAGAIDSRSPASSNSNQAFAENRATGRGFQTDGADRDDEAAEVTADRAERPAPAATPKALPQNAELRASSEAERMDQAIEPAAGPPASPRTRAGQTELEKKRSDATRRVRGKTFEQRDNVWYDTAYTGQPTTNVRRATNRYRALDKDLRAITDSIPGTVVVVWKQTAYRISP
jgi:hypothetical protein